MIVFAAATVSLVDYYVLPLSRVPVARFIVPLAPKKEDRVLQKKAGDGAKKNENAWPVGTEVRKVRVSS